MGDTRAEATTADSSGGAPAEAPVDAPEDGSADVSAGVAPGAAEAAPADVSVGAPGPPPRRNTTGDYVRAFVRGVGETMVTLGLVVLLFVVYELWVTNIYAHAKQVKAHDTLDSGVEGAQGSAQG